MADEWRELGDEEMPFDPSKSAENQTPQEPSTENAGQWREIGDEDPQEHHEQVPPAADADQWRELGEETPQDEQTPAATQIEETPTEDPNANQWREIGDETPRPETAPEEHVDEYAAETPREVEEPVADGGIRSTEQEDEAQYPNEAAQQAYHAEEDAANGAQENYPTEGAYPQEEAPVTDEPEAQDAAPADENADQWRELGEQEPEEPQDHQDHHERAAPAEGDNQWQEIGEEEPQGHHEEAQDAEGVPVEQDPSGYQPVMATRTLIDDPPAPTEEQPAEDADQWRELGEEKPQDEQPPAATQIEETPTEDPNANQWREIGDETPRPETAPEEHVDEYAAETPREVEEPVADGGIRSTEQEDEAQYPNEAAQQAYHAEEDAANGAQENYPTEGAYPQEEAPVTDEPEAQDAAPADENADQWRELGDDEGEAEKPAAAQFQPVMATRMAPVNNRVVKPNTRNVRQVDRWEPVAYDKAEESEDEFELSTCVDPVYVPMDDADAGFQNGHPDITGEVMSCFDEPNLLYRVISRDADNNATWAFYNDSLNYEMHVQFTFGRNSRITPLDDTKMEQNDKGEFVCETVVYPTETEYFITGHVNGFTSKLRAIPLTEDYHNNRRAIALKTIQDEQDTIKQITDSDVAEEVLQACIANGVPFVDPEFPPCQESLEAGGKRNFKPLAWARPSMYLPQEMVDQVRLFRSHPQPGVVDPGELGDTWVMCSVSSVSEDPQRLLGMFRHPEGKEAAQREHAVGAYRVTFSKDGWWRSVLVDDYLPVSAGRPKFARSAKDPAEIWPCILQKAYAKLHGSYGKICSGDPLHALHDMTGFSTVRFDEAMSNSARGNDNDLFDDLIRGVRAGYTTIVNTPGKEPKVGATPSAQAEEYRKVGLLPGHAYTILDAKHFPDVDDLRLVKIRNAWGRGLEWNGDWGDNDSKWDEHPDVAEVCNFQKAADGTFWMSWEDTLKYFNGGGICFSHTPAYDYRMNCAFYDQVPSCVLEVEVQSPTWMTIVISQEDKRSRKDGGEYQPVMISVAQPVDNGMYKVAFNSEASAIRPSSDRWTFLEARDVSMVQRFDAGKYLIVPRLMKTEDQPSEVPFLLGVIANRAVGTEEVSIKFKALRPESRVFENYPKFADDTTETTEEVQYQKRPPGAGFPQAQMGRQIEA